LTRSFSREGDRERATRIVRHAMPVRLTTLSAWVREEPTRLSVVATRGPGEALRALTPVPLPAGDALPEKVLFALLPHALPREGRSELVRKDRAVEQLGRER
jgi:hypothetical protein